MESQPQAIAPLDERLDTHPTITKDAWHAPELHKSALNERTNFNFAGTHLDGTFPTTTSLVS
jgi:hypothetical protein